ncbi:hypothetical protein [Flavihumibacter profundi]|uniref:hypothetical protein n=1 Tax=Flavihumibacter profundi TaxID=2716883 RepID=UPI001CC5529F|nr:hypothetical protein [Flavihumibacter profundi]MBZ5855713.1 hypothetical protein [Flavihumibacter profundi]
MFGGKTNCLVLLFAFCLSGCSKSKKEEQEQQVFSKEAVAIPLSPAFPGEVSGMADSYSMPGYLWLLQDSDNPAELLTVSHDGKQGNHVHINGVSNRDWEDMAIGNGPESGKKYIYIEDAGDNFLAFNTYYIYRFAEPEIGVTEVSDADKIGFVYDDGLHHNTEAILFDNSSNNIILVTKESPAQIFTLHYPYNLYGINTAVKSGVLKLSGITGAALSPNGQELLLRTYQTIYYWQKTGGGSIEAMLQDTVLESIPSNEPQGESITFRNDNGGFFTLSENAGLPVQLNLYFFPRK